MATETEIALANENAKLLQQLSALLKEYAELCSLFCKKPEHNPVYRDAKAVFK